MRWTHTKRAALSLRGQNPVRGRCELGRNMDDDRTAAFMVVRPQILVLEGSEKTRQEISARVSHTRVPTIATEITRKLICNHPG